MSPSSPPLPPFFAFVFTSVLQLMPGNVHGISSGSKLGPHVYAFTISKFNIYHKNLLLSQALALYITKQGKQAANSFISFNTLASSGGHWQQRFLDNETFKIWVWGCRC